MKIFGVGLLLVVAAFVSGWFLADRKPYVEIVGGKPVAQPTSLSDGSKIRYFGMIDSKTYYVIYRHPNVNLDSEFKVYMGASHELKNIPVSNASFKEEDLVSQDVKTKLRYAQIDTEQGQFKMYAFDDGLPSGTFNGKTLWEHYLVDNNK